MSDAPNDPDVNQMMAVFDKLSRQADTAKNEMAMAVNSFVGRAQDIIAAKIAENAQLRAQVAKRDEKIAELRAQVAERDATIERYAMESVAKDMRIESLTASLEDMRNRWKDAEQDWMQLREQVADLWTQLADRDATVASLVERLNRCTDDYGAVCGVTTMPHYPVLQPDGQLAIWSTIVDSFTCFNCTPIEAADELMAWHKDESARALSLCERVAKGEIPFEHWRTWENRVTLAIVLHGRDDETVQYALEITPDCTRIDAMVAESLANDSP